MEENVQKQTTLQSANGVGTQNIINESRKDQFLAQSSWTNTKQLNQSQVLRSVSPSMISSRAIVEVDSPFEKENQPVTQVKTRRRSSIFEETIMPDPSVCRWLLDIISEDEHMTKESAHFILSGPQLIRVVAYTYEVLE
ncbi:MAG: hypothetical protein EZS28_034250, partial [Streblomastix strix]